MAETTTTDAIETKKVTDLGEKTTPEDDDLFMAGDAGGSALKKMKWFNLLEAIKTKIAEWTFDTLTTTSKTITGALNELSNNAYRVDNTAHPLGAVDLNNDTFWNPGVWKCTKGTAGSVNSVPVTTKGFKLIIEYLNGDIMQTLKYTDGRIFCRTKSDSGIGEWKEITNDALEDAMRRRIVVGSTNDCMIVVTNQTLEFKDGTATINAGSIGTAYGKTISNVLVQIKSAGSTVITSAAVSNGVVTTKAYNASANTVYTGSLACTIALFLS